MTRYSYWLYQKSATFADTRCDLVRKMDLKLSKFTSNYHFGVEGEAERVHRRAVDHRKHVHLHRLSPLSHLISSLIANFSCSNSNLKAVLFIQVIKTIWCSPKVTRGLPLVTNTHHKLSANTAHRRAVDHRKHVHLHRQRVDF